MEIKRQQVETTVRETIATLRGIEPESISNDDNLENDLGMDSLDLIETIMVLERELSIMIPDDEEITKDMTVEKFTDAIYTYCNE